MRSTLPLSRSFRLVAVAGLCVFLSACSAKVPESKELIDAVQVGPIVAIGDTIRYGERLTGTIRDVDSEGELLGQPLTTVEVGAGGRRGLLDVVQDGERTYASWVNKEDRVVIGQVAPGGTRIIWVGPSAAADNIGGAMAMSPMGRITVALGDMQRNEVASDPRAFEGKIVTLDPDASADQLPNIISRNWVNPGGVTYDANEHMWVVDNGTDTSRLSRAGEDGSVGTPTDLGNNVAPSDLEMFGSSELLVCERNTRQLKRYLINDGTEAIPGRLVARDCAGGVAELSDGRIVYATDTTLRITSE